MMKHRRWLVLIAPVLLLGALIGVYPSVQLPTQSTAHQTDESVGTKKANLTDEKGSRSTNETLTAEAIYQKLNPAVATVYGADGVGSGIVVRSSGLVLTSKHLVNNSANVKVKTASGATYEGKVVDFDLQHDLALIKLHQSLTLPTVTLGDFTSAKLSDRLYAIGSPAGKAGTMTTGTFSGINEKGSLKTSAGLLNPGNSGGPLVNAKGEVIGVNKGLLPDNSGLAAPVSAAQALIGRFETINGTSP